MKKATSTPTRGVELVEDALGQSLQSITRYLFGVTPPEDLTGDGMTTLSFDHTMLSLRTGHNEDFMVVERGPIIHDTLDLNYWTKVELSTEADFSALIGKRLCYVDCYTDGFEDVALVFGFDGGKRLAIVLDDTDLLFISNFDPSQRNSSGITPQLRTRIELNC